MSRMKKIMVVDAVLSNLAIGYKNNNLIGTQLMPIVGVKKESVRIPVFGETAYLLHQTERAIRGDSNRMSPEAFDMLDVTLKEHDLEYPIDYREKKGSYFGLQSIATRHATLGVHLRREKAIADMVQNPDNYAATNKLALSGTSQFSDPNSDVIGIFDDAKEAVRKSTGIDPNTLTLDNATYKWLRRHPQLLGLLRVSNGMLRHDDLADTLEFKEIIVGKSVHAEKDPASNKFVKHDFWQKLAHVSYKAEKEANVDASEYEPSFGYTLQKKDSVFVDKYEENGGKVELVRSTDTYKAVMTMPDAGYLISNTVA